MPYLVIYINWALTFKHWLVRCGSNTNHPKKHVFKDIGILHALILLTMSCSIFNIIMMIYMLIEE